MSTAAGFSIWLGRSSLPQEPIISWVLPGIAYNPTVAILEPGESLTIATDLWDYDVLWYDDQLCPLTLKYSPEDLAAIYSSGGTKYELVTMRDYESECAMELQFTVEPFYDAPPPTIVP